MQRAVSFAFVIAISSSLACKPPDKARSCTDIAALPSTSQIQLTRVFEQVDIPETIALRQIPESTRWLLVAQTGQVYAFTRDDDPSVVIDVSEQLAVESEAGLLGLAIDPSFASTGHVYLSYTTPGPGAFVSRIARFTSVDGGLSFDPASEAIIFELSQPYTNHNGGDIHFGPDGYLYLGLGDGGSSEDPQGHGQNTDTLLGSMIRIDVIGGDPYAIPADNPFAQGGGAPEIFAWGLRNPWRFSFDRESGELWAGDVGQYDWEEVNRVRLGGNYGWNLKEGDHCFATDPCDDPALIDPVAEYANPDDASVVGGYVYRGNAMPQLRGRYIYTDFYLRTIWGVVDGAQPEVLLESSGHTLSAFAEGNDGELYGLDFSGGIWKLEPNPDANEAGEPPSSLRETGCVDPEDPTRASGAALAYTVGVPFWSDGADKQRWLHVPEGGVIEIDAQGDWALPPGSVAVKQFELEGRPVETRLLVHHDDGRWAGYSYAWNEAGTDAELLRAGEQRNFEQGEWLYPSRADCMACHTRAAGTSLGLENLQIQDQAELQAFVDRAWLASLPSSEGLPSGEGDANEGDAQLELRARAYLHANCSHCHRPAGPPNTPGDYRWQAGSAGMGICGVEPVAGDLGVPGASILDPGSPESSVLSLRLHAQSEERMPQLGSLVHDEAGIALIDAWISSLVACP